MTTKKLIYILNSYSEKESSHYHHVIGLLEALAGRGVEIVLLIEKAEALPVLADKNIAVLNLKQRVAPFRFVELFLAVSRLIRRGYATTYVRISAPAALVATLAHRLWGGATFLWQSGTTFEFDAAQPASLKKLRWYLGSRLPNLLARRYVHCFVTGPAGMADYYARVGGVPREKIRILHNDIDIGRFAPPPDRAARRAAWLAARRLPPQTLVLLLVHRLSPVRQTQLYFPACLALARDEGWLEQIVVVVAGDGAERPALEAEARKLGVDDRCLFLGSVPNRDIQLLYAVADIFLHPTYNEGFPRVILEAMAAALPIVSTDAGGTRELVGDLQGGLIVSRDEPAAFARCLERLCDDPELRQRVAEENRVHVERFSTEKVAAMYEKVLFA